MEYIVREMNIPEGVEPPLKSIIYLPELQEYVFGFGNSEYDRAFVAEAKGKIIGAAWVRIMNDYGHVDDDTPSLAMSLYKEYRGLGIGTALLTAFLLHLKSKGYSKVSLSVQKENYAKKVYEKVGFAVFDENEEEYIMLARLKCL